MKQEQIEQIVAATDNLIAQSISEAVAEQFKMNRNIATVRDAWNEYCHGGPSANNAILPSIKELDVQNPKWKGSKSTTPGEVLSTEASVMASY